MPYVRVLVTSFALLIAVATQDALAFAATHAPQSFSAPRSPQQRAGDASGRAHQVPTSATDKSQGGKSAAHLPGAGELAEVSPDEHAGASHVAGGVRGTQPVRTTEPPDWMRRRPKAGPQPRQAQPTAKASAPASASREPSTAGGITTPDPEGDTGIEDVAARTENTSVFRNYDGTKTTRVYSRPVHYRKPDGTFAQIDTALSLGRDNRWHETASNQNLSFATSADARSLVTMTIDADHVLSYGLQGATKVGGKVSGNTVTYPGAAPKTDLVYNALAAGVKETVVLHDATAPTSWTFPLNLTGLTPSIGSEGEMAFKDDSGTVRAVIPTGSMEDSAKDSRSGVGAMSDGVKYSLVRDGGTPALRMDLDAAWLHDPKRVFPVQVDPTSSAQIGAGKSTYVYSGFSANNSTAGELRVGTYDGGGHVANTYLTFPGVANIGANFVLAVDLKIANTHSWSCDRRSVNVHEITSPWNPDTIRNYPGLNIGQWLGSESFAGGDTCGGIQWATIHLGSDQTSPGSVLANYWTHGGANYGLALTADPWDNYAFKKFDSTNTGYPPYLAITYTDWAATYNSVSNYIPPTALQAGSAQVTLRNEAANWWNSSSMQVRARVFDANWNEVAVNAPLTGVSGLVKTGELAAVTVPIPPLPVGPQYQVCWDGYVYGSASLHDSYGVKYGNCIWVSSQNVPPQLDTVEPLGNTVVGVLSPQLYATGHDPDNNPGTGLDYQFLVYTNPKSGSPEVIADSGWQPNSSWTVPAGKLSWNQTYLWRVKIGDHQGESLLTDYTPFTTAVQQPVITSRLGGTAGNGTTRTFDAQAGNYTTSATDAAVKAVGPALGVSRTYNSLDPRTTTLFGSGWSSAYDMSVVPDADGTGSVVLTTGSGRSERFGRNDFQLTQLAGIGDQTGDGVDDAVTVDFSTGKLWLYPGPDFSQAKRRWLGEGWNGISQLTGGDVTGDGIGDAIGVVSWNGSLRLFPGKSGGGFLDPITIGDSGWNDMAFLTVTAPLTGDGRKVLLAVEKSSGNLYAYPVNTDGSLGARASLGGGWNSMAELVGGDFNHDGRGDVMGIETSTAKLWLYPGTGAATLGTSTLGTRTQIGTGWNTMRDLAPVNGLPGDPGTDILSIKKADGLQYLYHSAGQWTGTTRTTTGMPLYTSPSGEFETLAANAGGGWILADKSGTVYTFSQKSGSGYLLSRITDREQHSQALHYTSGKLDTVTDEVSGRALHFTWTADGRHIAQVATDPATGADASTALVWTYAYDAANADQLAQVCTPPAGSNSARPCTTYSYTPGSHLRSAVLDTAPSSYWRLGEASGTTANSEVIANQGSDKATYTNVALGSAPGPLSGAATTTATFDGTGSSVTLPNASLRNNYLALGLWFKTTSPGVLVGYQNTPLAGTPSHASSPLYIGTDGKLRAEFYGPAIGFNPLTSSGTVTDGVWHFAVLSGSGDSQTLYLDGAAVGTRTGAIDPLDTDYTYLGAGYTQGIPWPAAPAAGADGNNHFSGQIAEVALYPQALGDGTVKSQWAAGRTASSQLTTLKLPSGKTKLDVVYDAVQDRATQVTDANGGVWKLNTPSVSGSEQEYRSAVMGSHPAGYWRLAESSASQAANMIYSPRPTPNNGTYSNVALGGVGPMTGSAGAATFDGTTSWAEIPAAYAPTSGPGALGVWFKTTSPGVLISYQSFPIGGQAASGDQWNPALYVGTDGKLHGQFWTGAASNTLASSASVTDGAWHFALLSADNPSSQTLYLDGAAVAGPLNATIKANGDNNVYVGAGNVSSGWPGAPTDKTGHFKGQIANVTAFDHGLLYGDKVRDMFQAAANGAAAYDSAVIDARPTGYWRLSDQAGNQASEVLSSAALAQNQGAYNNVTLGTAGPYATGGTTAASFNGTDSHVQLPATAVPRTGGTATVEIWFKTAEPGVLYGYQSFPLGASTTGGKWTPALYVGTDGKLYGQLWNGSSANTAVSAATVSDDKWHMATLVATSTDGVMSQQLYIDGAASGTPVTGTSKYNGDTYAYLGAGTVKNWPSAPADASGHFKGALADFSYYPYALSTSTVARHYATATTQPGQAVTHSANYRAAVVLANPSAYWRLNEPMGTTTAQDQLGTALPNQDHGTYTNTTLGTAGPSGTSDGTAATFNGTTSVLQLPASAAVVKGPNTVELWFKTTTAGTLYSFQSFPLGTAHTPAVDQWNPALYVGTDGKLYGALWTGDGVNALASSRTVNDGAWHHAALAGDDSGQTLYLDGAESATSSTPRQIYYNGSAFVYVGAGTADGGWPNHPTSPDGRFTGSIAQVAVYRTRLDTEAVSSHFKAMGSAASPTKITYVSVKDPDDHTLSWRWDTRTGKLAATVDPTTGITRYTYDTHGYLYSVTDPNGHTVTTGHDERGNTVSTTTCTTAAECHTAYATYSIDTVNPFNPTNDHQTTYSDARSKDASDDTYTTSYTYNSAGESNAQNLWIGPEEVLSR
ncbi:LamG-like jellyroll fold domain-containing protein [Kitasatospora sp. KL5]|uniref:LamG-like jellyroll fold domain-containing protein n=1 Tax=Kitasatospora sp. KL5 TaxID=3425125 RepID=UPI003D6E3207